MSYCSGLPDPASPMAANFTEFGAEGSSTSWAVTLHHAAMTRSRVVSRVTRVRSIRGARGPDVLENVLRLPPASRRRRIRVTLWGASSTESRCNQAHQEEDDEHKEENSGYLGRRESYNPETKYARDDRDH